MYTITNHNGVDKLHYSYRAEQLQESVADLTANLGKRRASENAPHLLDLIGMTKDESSLFTRYAKAAMAEVFDVLNGAAYETPKECVWRDGVIDLIPMPQANFNDYAFSASLINGKYVTIEGDMQIDTAIDIDKYYIDFKIKVNYTAETTILDTGMTFAEAKTMYMHVSKGNYRTTSGDRFLLNPLTAQIPLDGETELLSAQRVVPDTIVAEYMQGSLKVQECDPTYLDNGDVIKINGTSYLMIADTNTNELDLSKDAVLLDSRELTEGIHYYFEKPSNLNASVAPLDTAIEDAIVNRIIWKWLAMAYPSEAATYDAFYKEAINQVRIRSNQVFHKQYSKTPRIL